MPIKPTDPLSQGNKPNSTGLSVDPSPPSRYKRTPTDSQSPRSLSPPGPLARPAIHLEGRSTSAMPLVARAGVNPDIKKVYAALSQTEGTVVVLPEVPRRLAQSRHKNDPVLPTDVAIASEPEFLEWPVTPDDDGDLIHPGPLASAGETRTILPAEVIDARKRIEATVPALLRQIVEQDPRSGPAIGARAGLLFELQESAQLMSKHRHDFREFFERTLAVSLEKLSGFKGDFVQLNRNLALLAAMPDEASQSVVDRYVLGAIGVGAKLELVKMDGRAGREASPGRKARGPSSPKATPSRAGKAVQQRERVQGAVSSHISRFCEPMDSEEAMEAAGELAGTTMLANLRVHLCSDLLARPDAEVAMIARNLINSAQALQPSNAHLGVLRDVLIDVLELRGNLADIAAVLRNTPFGVVSQQPAAQVREVQNALSAPGVNAAGFSAEVVSPDEPDRAEALALFEHLMAQAREEQPHSLEAQWALLVDQLSLQLRKDPSMVDQFFMTLPLETLETITGTPNTAGTKQDLHDDLIAVARETLDDRRAALGTRRV